tara:strand:+ start:2089 stop:3795 length:1707 start_codon:yes stop_codon:yes gene_type:complete
MCDKLVYDLSQEVEGSPSVFIRKDWLDIIDNQNQNYASNTSVIDTSSLVNSNKFLSFREGYLSVPMLLTLSNITGTSAFAPATAGTSADYAVGLKSWFGNIFHSATIEYNGVSIVQQTPFINMLNSFRLMTTLSLNDIQVQGATIGFYPDTPSAWSFELVASTKGQGLCNNKNGIAVASALGGKHNDYERSTGNVGLYKRQQYINFDPAGLCGATATYGDFLTSTTATQVWKSHISTKVDGVANPASAGVFQISIQATIYLKHLHPFFNSIPIMKGAYLKCTLFLNNTSTKFTVDGNGVQTLNSVSNAVGGVNPIMIASGEAGSGCAGLGAGIYIANLSVGNKCLDAELSTVPVGKVASSIYLYVPSYIYSPVFEQAYLSSPVKTVKYEDAYQYQVLNVSAGAQINQLISNGIANMKSILIVPILATGAGGNTLTVPSYQSPYDPAGCGATAPLVMLTSFNCVVSGQNTIYNSQRFAFQEFNNHLACANGVNGNQTDGLTSGLLSQLDFDMAGSYYYLDLSRMLPVETSVPKSVQLIGQNASAKALSYFVFVSYETEISIDALTGTRV